ncbi:uncharacterized protein LOC118435552 [Folsomia candida]|uniref:uncharacterized protein LOC118435552 n=1 Tax=Folsomia candida TaxID=158441 RepID=UPI001604E27D|nr:uncharacterized protein LOC118435552 [Folsomia candida]
MQAEIDQPEIQMDNVDLVVNDVLMMPGILDQVFSHLDLDTLKSVRLVCTVWDDVGAKFLGKNGRLTFSRLPIPWYTRCKELTSFNHNLAKNVTLHMKCYCLRDCVCSRTEVQFNRILPSNFAILLPQIFDKLSTLKVNVENRFNPHLHEMWSNYQFPNLTRISISVTLANELDLEEHVDVMLQMKFQPLKHLKVLSLKIFPNFDDHFSGVVCSPLCQKLLNVAPNLEKFDITMNFFPGLTPCRKLKELRLDYCECHDLPNVHVDIPEMARMLENCRDSLEKLTLDYLCGNLPSLLLNLNFPNLTHPCIDAAYVYKIEASLNTTDLPKLTHLSIKSLCDISITIGAFHLRHPGITSLSVNCGHCAQIGSQEDGHPAGTCPSFPRCEGV